MSRTVKLFDRTGLSLGGMCLQVALRWCSYRRGVILSLCRCSLEWWKDLSCRVRSAAVTIAVRMALTMGPVNRYLGKLESDGAGVAQDAGPDLDQFQSQACQRPVVQTFFGFSGRFCPTIRPLF